MEETILRFPHLGRQIFEKLNNQSLTTSRKIGKNWKSFIDNEKFLTFAIIKKMTNASDKSIWKRLQIQTRKESRNFLIELINVYRKFPKNTGQVNPTRDDNEDPYLRDTPLHQGAFCPISVLWGSNKSILELTL